MELPKKILVPVDLSQRSERAIEYAAGLATLYGAGLVLVTNVNMAERVALEEYGLVEGKAAAETATTRLKKLGAHYAPSVTVSTMARFHNSAADGILHAADDCEADAIVLASHGRTGMSRWMLGSVAERVVRSANVPVTVLPARDL